MIFSFPDMLEKTTVLAVVEMPKGTTHKYELEKETKELVLDRVLPVQVPVNYGFVVDTLSEDGDPTDVFIASMEPIPPLTKVQVELVGIIKCVDGGKEDDKLFGYIKNDKKTKTVLNSEELKTQIIRYLKTYKKEMVVLKAMGTKEASEKVKEATLFFLKTNAII